MARVSDTYTAPTQASGYSPSVSTEFAMIGKIAYSVIREVVAKNPLSEFMKANIENGDTIEQAIVKLVESSAYDSTGAGALSRDTTVKMAVRYFKNWTRKKYKTTVDMIELRKYLEGSTSAEEVATKLVSVLGQSDIHDLYQGIKGLLAWGSTNGSNGSNDTALVNVGTVAALTTSIDYKGILKKVKDTVSGMSFVNNSFNKGGILRATNKDDIIVVMPYSIKNSIDVDELTGFFNLSKGEIKNKIIELDTTDKKIYVLDKNSILVYTRLYQMLDQLNADGAFYNYFLHVERLFAISPLFDGAFFTYAEPTVE